MIRTLFGLGVLMFGVAATAAPTRADLQQLEQQIQQEQRVQRESGRKADELSGEVKSVQRQMVRLARTVQAKEDDLTRLEKRQAQTLSRQSELEQRLNLTERQLVRLVTGMQVQALRPPELAVMRADWPLSLARGRMIMGYSLPVIRDTNRQVRSDLSELTRLRATLQDQIAQIKATRTQLSEQSAQMDKLLQQKSLLQAQYRVSQAQSQERIKTLGTQARDLKDLLDRLAAEKKSRQTQNAMRHLQETRPDFRNPFAGGTNTADTGAFARARGRLPYPVRGTITQSFGAETLAGAHTKGIIIHGRASARVIAPFDGTVLFAGPFKNYGELVIMDHGDNYLTLLAGMGNLNTSVGQEVLAGEPIGQMNTTKPDLYMEIRANGQPVDPEPWLSH